MKIAVLMGGISRERKISLISGENVLKALKKLGHNVTKVDVTEDFPSRLESLRDFDLIFNEMAEFKLCSTGLELDTQDPECWRVPSVSTKLPLIASYHPM